MNFQKDFKTKECISGGYKLEELKNFCRHLSLPISGNKSQLCQRLDNYLIQNSKTSEVKALTKAINNSTKMDSLPDLAILEIIKSMDAVDIKNYCLSSKRILDVCDNHKSVIKDLLDPEKKIKNVLFKLLDFCTGKDSVKYYTRYEYDGNNLSKYEKLMDSKKIVIAAKSGDDSETLSFVLRILIDNNLGNFEILLQNYDYDLNVLLQKDFEVKDIVKRLIANGNLQQYDDHVSDTTKCKPNKIYDKQKLNCNYKNRY